MAKRSARSAATVRPSVSTLEEVAARAGVSRSTASRAINGGVRVSPQALASVERAVAELGYTPNRAARSLVTRRTDSIALVVPEPDEHVLTDPFFAGVLSGVSAAFADSDVQVVLVLARPGQTQRTIRYLRNGHVDGAIVVSHHTDDELDRTLADVRLPSVFVGRPMTAGGGNRPGLPYVDLDNVEGGRLATRRLVDIGRRRIGTIAGPQDMSAGVDRLTGWRAAMAAAGLADDAVAYGDFTFAGGRAAARRLLEAHPDLDGIVVASDLMASGALTVLAAAGRAVPDGLTIGAVSDARAW